MKIGYARFSSADQEESSQKYMLERNGCELIFTDISSGGTREDRTELDKALSKAQEGDVFVVWRLDRLGRSLKHLIKIIEQLEERKIHFVSLTEGFDTTAPAGKMLFYVIRAMGDYERNMIRERTKAGLQAARARGRHGGRKEKLTSKQVQTLLEMYGTENYSVAEICRKFGISRPTVYRYLRQKSNN